MGYGGSVTPPKHHWTSSSAGRGTLLYLLGIRGAAVHYLSIRRSLNTRVLRLFNDDRCDENTKALVREYLTGAEGGA